MSIITVDEYRLILPMPRIPEPEKRCSYELDSDVITLLDSDPDGLQVGLLVLSEDFPEGTEILEIETDTIKVSENALATDISFIEFFGVNKEEDEKIKMYIDVVTEYLLSLCDNDLKFETSGYPSIFKFLTVKAVSKMMDSLLKDNNIQSESLSRYSVSYKNDNSTSDIMFDVSDLKIIKKYSRAGKITFKNAYGCETV